MTEDDALRATARALYETPNVQIDDDAVIDFSLDGGAWITARVWVATPADAGE